MYTSGAWDGFWEQAGWGRQPMQAFELNFGEKNDVLGQGVDVIGKFIVRGEYDKTTGIISFRKLYLGKHTVHYEGKPDGEGSILGTWLIESTWGDQKGPFMIKPVLKKPSGNEEIFEIKPKK
jgi:hypothetical protein